MTEPYYTRREIVDFRDLINQSTVIYGNKNAFLVSGVMGERVGITYKQLKKDIEAVGTEFINMGLKREQVAVIGDNSYEWCLTYLGMTCGTGTIVPIDKDLPIQEIGEILLKSRSHAVVFSENVRDKIFAVKDGLPELKHLISMDANEDDDDVIAFKSVLRKGNELLKIGDQKFLNARLDAKETAILQYVIDDLDVLKGIMISEENVCANIRYLTSVIDIRESDLALSVLPLNNSLESITNFLAMLYSGATIAFCDGGNVFKNMKEVKPTVIVADTKFYESFYKDIWTNARKNRKYNKLKRNIRFSNLFGKHDIEIRKKKFINVLENYGGRLRLGICNDNFVNVKILKGLQDLGVLVIQGYSMPEASGTVFINHVKKYKNNSIGLSIPGVEVLINEPNEVGIGEMLLKSKVIMQGYYNDEEETSKAFTKDNFLKTGILVRKDKEEFFYILGKKKNIIINNEGNYIFPEEIENKVENSMFIKQCLVYCKQMGNKNELKVCTIIVPDFDAIQDIEGKSKFDVEGIRKIVAREIKKCNKKLPTYKRIKGFELRNDELDNDMIRGIRRVI